MDVVVFEFTLEGGFIGPEKAAVAVFFAVDVLAFVAGAVWPDFDAEAVLFVCFPVAFVFCAVHVLVGSFSVSFIVEPLTFVDISVLMNQTPFTVGHIIFPKSLILRAICPYLYSFPLSHPLCIPFSNINRSIIKLIWPPTYHILKRSLFSELFIVNKLL